MISFIIPFVTVEEGKFLNLNEGFDVTDSSSIVYSTIKTIKNINKLKCEKEIILVDNSHTWPNLDLPNLKVIKGWQAVPLEELKNVPEFMNHMEIQDSLKQKDSDNRMFDNFGCDTQWAAMAFHQGIQESKGDYIVLQHNDTFYHQDRIDEMIEHMEKNKLAYISADNKKIWISTYLLYREQIDKYIKVFPTDIVRMSPEGGGYVQTQKIGFADAYFFLCKRNFFDNYNIDWKYGDTNHGATMYCLDNNLKYLHLGPYHDNPNWDTGEVLHTYYYENQPFLTHLKGGFSEQKMSSKDHEYDFNNYLEGLKNAK